MGQGPDRHRSGRCGSVHASGDSEEGEGAVKAGGAELLYFFVAYTSIC